MKVNKETAISTSKVLLVPYDAHHVERYHEWMQNEALREATASDLLSLAEEYENQQSWRTASDKLTFIVCQPAAAAPAAGSSTTAHAQPKHEAPRGPAIRAGEDDAPARMVGDVNLFLTPCDDEHDEETESAGGGEKETAMSDVKGEIDIMIAAPEHRRRGLGEAAVRAFLRYLVENRDAILREYTGGSGGGDVKVARLKRLVAKIHADNVGSIRLFGGLGFRRQGDPDYFNEVTMVLSDFPPASDILATAEKGTEYRECFYHRSWLKE